MTDDEKRRVIEALQAVDDLIEHQFTGTRDGMTALQHTSDDCREALVIMRGDIPTREPVAWIVHAECPWVTMDPPMMGGLPRTPLYK